MSSESLSQRLATLLRVGLLSWSATLMIMVATAVPASAHDGLVSSTPTDGATVANTPGSVVLTFVDPAITLGTAVRVTDADGREVQTGAPRLVDTTVTQTLPPGAPAGTYVVDWRVTSADGHPITGTFSFTAQGPGPGSPTSQPASPAPAPTSDSSGPVPAGLKLLIGVVAIVFGITVARRSSRQAHNDNRHRT